MNLVRHQFLHEFRKHRVLLALLGGFLLLDLLTNLGLFEPSLGVNMFQRGQLGAMFGALLPFVLANLLGAICAFSVLNDSPPRTEAFLRTRPMPRAILYRAKALFILAFVAAPPMVFEALSLLLNGVGFVDLLHGCLERALFVLPCVVIVAAFTALWPSGRKLGIGVVVFEIIAVVLGVIIWIGVALFSRWTEMPIGFMREQEPGVLHLLVGLWFAAVGLAWAAWRNALCRWTERKLWIRLTGVAAAGSLAVALWPIPNLRVQAVAQAEAEATAAQLSFHHAPGTLTMSLNHQLHPAGRIGISASPRVEGVPNSWVIHWFARDFEMTMEDGERLRPLRPMREPRIGQRWTFSSQDDHRATLQGLPPETLIQRSFFSQRPGFSSGPFKLGPTGPHINQTVSLSARAIGHCYELETVADLPLERGASAEEDNGRWTIVSPVKELNKMGRFGSIALEHRQVRFALTSQLESRRSRFWPDDQYRFALFRKDSAILTGGDQNTWVARQSGGHSAFGRKTVRVDFESGPLAKDTTFTAGESTRLLIFRYRFVGEIENAWSHSDLLLSDIRPRGGSSNFMENEDLSSTELKRRLEALEAPGPDASRVEVGGYIDAVLQLVEAGRASSSRAEPAVARLAPLVPEHVDAFFDALPFAPHYAGMALMNALRTGLSEEQKDRLFTELRQQPNLARIVLERGWTDAGREPILDLLNHANPLPYAAIQAIAWFEEPATYARLLDHIEAGQSSAGYEIVRKLPGIAPQLNEMVARTWIRRDRTFRHNIDLDNRRRIALMHGHPGALEEAYRLLDAVVQNELSGAHIFLTEWMGKSLVLPEVKREDRYDEEKLAAAMTARTPTDFQYDPVRRVYRPRMKPEREIQ